MIIEKLGEFSERQLITLSQALSTLKEGAETTGEV